MNAAALDRLIAREEALVAALDEGDVARLEAASAALRDALADVAACGAWSMHGELGVRAIHALRVAEGARARIAYLADRTRRRLDRLAGLAGAPRAHAYGRQGKLA